jgi:hypothetical protein
MSTRCYYFQYYDPVCCSPYDKDVPNVRSIEEHLLHEMILATKFHETFRYCCVSVGLNY